jgi:hypothetical protein
MTSSFHHYVFASLRVVASWRDGTGALVAGKLPGLNGKISCRPECRGPRLGSSAYRIGFGS